MTTQLELDLTRQTEAAAAEARVLVSYLRGRRQWVKARQIGADLDGMNERKVRALAALADAEIVSGPGCPGYKHIGSCTASELLEAASRLEAQARRMTSRAIKLRAAWCGLVHPRRQPP